MIQKQWDTNNKLVWKLINVKSEGFVVINSFTLSFDNRLNTYSLINIIEITIILKYKLNNVWNIIWKIERFKLTCIRKYLKINNWIINQYNLTLLFW